MYNPMNEESKEMLLKAAEMQVNGETELTMVEGLDKNFKKTLMDIKVVTRNEIKTLVKQFYQIQDQRKALSEQIRSIEMIFNEKEDDGKSNKGRTRNKKEVSNPNKNVTLELLYYLLKNLTILENNIKKCLEIVVEKNEVGKWLMEIHGIGPILAANLLASFEIQGREYASQFISYAGLNDNNRPWLGMEKSKKIINEVLNGEKEITDEHVILIAAKTQWSYEYLLSNAYNNETKKWSKNEIEKACSKIPYNAEVKKMMFLVGSSFQWMCNKPESLYGRLFSERRVYETKKNEDGEYADYAAKLLQEKNYNKSSEAYKCLSKGKLSKAHITMRALRWTEKIFLSHLFEEMYRVEYDKIPPRYYALEKYGTHNKEIQPEVAYTKVTGEL